MFIVPLVGGSGLSHILAKHGEADVRKLPATLARGRVEVHSGTRGNPGDPAKREVIAEDYIAVVAKPKAGAAWVITAISRRDKP